MVDPGAPLRGILERNIAAAVGSESAGYHLNHVTIEVDTSEVGPLDEGLEGLPMSVEGRFETREHPEGGTRWVFKARLVHLDAPGGEGPPLSAPPPPA